MSIESVAAYFEKHNLHFDIKEFDDSTENVEKAAVALGVEPALIAKTLAFRDSDAGILIVMKGDARVDNRKFKEQFKIKPTMLKPKEVEEITGHPVGGVCPFGLAREIRIFVDESLKQFKKVYPAAGSRNSCIEIAPDELCRITGAEWVNVCK